MLPESLILILFLWGISISVLILTDDLSFIRSWPNAKIKFIGIITSGLALILSFTPQRFEIATTSNTIVTYNQTITLTSPNGLGAVVSTASVDTVKFWGSILFLFLCCVDLFITLIEDPFGEGRKG